MGDSGAEVGLGVKKGLRVGLELTILFLTILFSTILLLTISFDFDTTRA